MTRTTWIDSREEAPVALATLIDDFLTKYETGDESRIAQGVENFTEALTDFYGFYPHLTTAAKYRP